MKNKRITFAVSKDNKEKIIGLAESFGLTTSAYCRCLALGIRNVNFVGPIQKVEFKSLKPPKIDSMRKTAFKEVLKELHNVLEERRNAVPELS